MLTLSLTQVGESNTLQIASLDAPIVMPMTTVFPWGNPLPYPPQPTGENPFGMSYNLVNNLYNTNYILFYPYLAGDENSLFRFELSW